MDISTIKTIEEFANYLSHQKKEEENTVARHISTQCKKEHQTEVRVDLVESEDGSNYTYYIYGWKPKRIPSYLKNHRNPSMKINEEFDYTSFTFWRTH